MTATTQAPPALVPFSGRIPPALRTQARVHAAVYDVDIQDILRDALTQYLEIPADLRTRAEVHATQNHTTFGPVLCEALAEYLDRHTTEES